MSLYEWYELYTSVANIYILDLPLFSSTRYFLLHNSNHLSPAENILCSALYKYDELLLQQTISICRQAQVVYTWQAPSVISFMQLCFVFILEVIPVLLAIALITLVERRAMGSIQRRRGPNVHGALGLLQPIADGVKLILKELFATTSANTVIFMSAPLFTLFLMLILWCMLPGANGYALIELQFTMLLFLIIGTFNVQTIIFAGWASNSKYAFLGGIRAASQMISYEICMSTVVASVFLFTGSYTIAEIVEAQYDTYLFFPLFPMFCLFFITSLAETNRTPFDLVEAEAELVAGYNVEYSAVFFALLFIAEYGNILLLSTFSTLLFFGGWIVPLCGSMCEGAALLGACAFAVKVLIHVLLFVLVRAAVPRYRYDQLMNIGWKTLLPLSLALLLLEAVALIIFS